MSVGVNQGPFGTLAYVALQALAYLSGNYDRAGGVVFHPLAGLAARVMNRLGSGAKNKTSRIGGFNTSLNSLPGAILADEILVEGAEQIRALIVIAGDPLNSIPGEKRLREAFNKLDTLVCIDLFENGTGRYADLLLPATSWLERWDVATTTSLFQHSSLLQYAKPIMEPPGEARPEVQILSELASAIGRPLYRSKLLNGSLRVSWDGALGRLTSLFAHLEKPVGGRPPYAFAVPRPRPGRYLGRGPNTPGHRVRFWDQRFEAERVRMDDFASRLLHDREAGVFLLIGRRRRIGHNSWLHNGRRGDSLENAAWMSAADLKGLGIADGGRLCVRSEAGELTIRAKPNDGVMPGTIVIPHGLQGANVNALIPSGPERAERLSGQHWMTGIPVRIEVIKERGGVERTAQCQPI
jgi:formate dehydrogenase